jgi:DNA repair protein RadC
MKKVEMNLHEGHRKRLQNRYKTGGADGLSDHNLLELLLFYSIPRVDTNETAHRLLNRFGTLDGVFKADIDSIAAVNGIGEKSALHIKLIFDIYNRISFQRAAVKKNMRDIENVRKYLVEKMRPYSNEVMMILMLNLSGELIDSKIISEGTKDRVGFDIRKIVEPAFACGASSIIIAHSHPDGKLEPSYQDISATSKMMSNLNSLGLVMIEHYIVNHNDVLGILDYIKKGEDKQNLIRFGLLPDFRDGGEEDDDFE